MQTIKINKDDVIIKIEHTKWSFDFFTMSVRGLEWTLKVPFHWNIYLKHLDKYIQALEDLINKIDNKNNI